MGWVIVGTVITVDRFAIATDQASETNAADVKRRYNLLRRWIKKTYINSVGRLTQSPASGSAGPDLLRPTEPSRLARVDRRHPLCA